MKLSEKREVCDKINLVIVDKSSHTTLYVVFKNYLKMSLASNSTKYYMHDNAPTL